MSSQKLVVVVCMVSALVAVASAQSFDWSKCQSGAQTEINRYRQTILSSAQKFANSLQQTGASASDIAPFQKGIDKLTQNLASLTNVQQSVDASRFTSVYLENLQIITSMLRESFRVSLFTGALDSYIEMGNSVFSANTQFMSAMTDLCVPNRKMVLPTV